MMFNLINFVVSLSINFILFSFFLFSLFSFLLIQFSLWLNKGCETLHRNSSFIHCLCNELGIIAALIHKSEDNDLSETGIGHNHHHHQHHSLLLHNVVMYLSLITSFSLLVIALVCQLMQRSRETSESSFILINLISWLTIIQLVFIIGAPFRVHFGLINLQLLCSIVPIFLHYIHLVSGFWMLSHSILLYQRLWRPVLLKSHCHRHLHRNSSSSSSFSFSFYESDSHTKANANSNSNSSSTKKCHSISSSLYNWVSYIRRIDIVLTNSWNNIHFFIFSTILPAISVLISYLLNPNGYETKK